MRVLITTRSTLAGLPLNVRTHIENLVHRGRLSALEKKETFQSKALIPVIR